MLLLNLAYQAAQNGARADFDKGVGALFTKTLDRVNPPYTAVNLSDQIRGNRVIRVWLGAAVGNAGDLQAAETEAGDELLKLFYRWLHITTVEGSADRENNDPFGPLFL